MFVATAATPSLDEASLAALQGVDLRLGTIAHRLVTANAPLCRHQVPATGVIVHAITQYDRDTQTAAREAFDFLTPVSVEAVVAGSAAAKAGILANDGLAAVGKQTLTATAEAPSAVDRDMALTALERAPTPVPVTIKRGGEQREMSIAAPMGCRARFEVLLGPDMTAQSDGKVVQIGVRYFERYTDDEVAVIVAHELSHIIMCHRTRLEAANVKGGLLGEIGRNAKLGQEAELEADRLGVALLHNAGYDPASAVRFWSEHGGEIDGGIFRSRTHPSTKRRIAAMKAAVAEIPAGMSFYKPAMLKQRDLSLNDVIRGRTGMPMRSALARAD